MYNFKTIQNYTSTNQTNQSSSSKLDFVNMLRFQKNTFFRGTCALETKILHVFQLTRSRKPTAEWLVT